MHLARCVVSAFSALLLLHLTVSSGGPSCAMAGLVARHATIASSSTQQTREANARHPHAAGHQHGGAAGGGAGLTPGAPEAPEAEWSLR